MVLLIVRVRVMNMQRCVSLDSHDEPVIVKAALHF